MELGASGYHSLNQLLHIWQNTKLLKDLVAAKEEAAMQLGKANVLESQITFLTHQNTHLLGCVTGTTPRMPPAPQ